MLHLSNNIKVRFSLTYQELLFCGKCMEAARLLLGSDKLVREVAAECGFSDVKYLITHFKRGYGCSPSDFRKQHGRSGDPLSESKYEELPLPSFREKVLRDFSVLELSVLEFDKAQMPDDPKHLISILPKAALKRR